MKLMTKSLKIIQRIINKMKTYTEQQVKELIKNACFAGYRVGYVIIKMLLVQSLIKLKEI